MRKAMAIACCLFACLFSTAQSISGRLTQVVNQPIRLEGFNGFTTYTIATSNTDAQGNFSLKYAKADNGMGYLVAADAKPVFVVLNGEQIVLQGTTLADKENLRVVLGQENKWFEQYATEHPRREQTLSAWNYLERIYKADPLFTPGKPTLNAIQKESARIRSEDNNFLAGLPEESYVRWYLPVRKLVSEVQIVAQYRPEEIQATTERFRKLDYADARLYTSGLLKDAIEGHFWLLENSGMALDTSYTEMKKSIDTMISCLAKDERKLNEITNYLFDLLERHSLFTASEYLALKVLNLSGCTLEQDLARQLETYRAMKKGNIVPDIAFSNSCFAPGFAPGKAPQKLSQLSANYILVVFGAGWCPQCKQELPEIAAYYAKWKAQKLEVVFVSLDETPASFYQFAGAFPFISVCDFKKWEGSVVKDYYVVGTPTLFLLDANRKILLRPRSAKQVDAWVDLNVNRGQ
jgi:thiol-disulfide isomerase/thioredoxin